MNLADVIAALGPEIILLIGGCVVLMLGMGGRSPGKGVSSFTLITLVIALYASLQSQPSGSAEIVPGLCLTALTSYVRWITLGIGTLLVLVNWNQPVASERGEYMAMVLFSLLGVLLTASANDLVVLFFAIELVSIPTYVLIALSREDARASEAAVKYFFLGALSAAILAYGLSFMYGAAGTTALHTFVDGTPRANFGFAGPMGTQATIGLLLVFAGLAFKIAAVPFHVYAADVYEGAASPVTGLLGFVPKLAGFVALCKILAACNWNLPDELNWMIWVIAAATMTAGNVLALLQKNVKRMLAYSSIAHTGYMLIALLVGPVAGEGPMRDGVAALLFYIAVYGVMNLGAFAVLSAFRSADRDIETLDQLAGLARHAPAATLALAICVFSLMGFPPTAGFLGKLYVFGSAFSLHDTHPMHGPLIALAIIGVLNSAIAAAYYLRIVATAYMGEGAESPVATGGAPVRWGLALCSIPMLVLFALPMGLTSRAREATVDLHRSIHVEATQVTLSVPAEPSAAGVRPPGVQPDDDTYSDP